MIRADVIEMANKEEEKLSFAAFAKEAEEARKRVLTYEEYFQLDPRKDGHIRPPKKSAGSSKGDTTYEQFVKDRASDNLFENDVSLAFIFQLFSFWKWSTSFGKPRRTKKIGSRGSGLT